MIPPTYTTVAIVGAVVVILLMALVILIIRSINRDYRSVYPRKRTSPRFLGTEFNEIVKEFDTKELIQGDICFDSTLGYLQWSGKKWVRINDPDLV